MRKIFLRRVFVGEFDAFLIKNLRWEKTCFAESEGSLVKLGVVLKNVYLPWILRWSGFQLRGQTQSTLTKLAILVLIYLFFWDIELFLCSICLLTGKMMASIFIPTKWQGGIHSGKPRFSVAWLNILGSTPVLSLFLAPEHLNSSTNVHFMKAWQKRTPFFLQKALPSGCFCSYKYNETQWGFRTDKILYKIACNLKVASFILK